MVGGYDQTTITDTRIRRTRTYSTNSSSEPTNLTSTTSTTYTHTCDYHTYNVLTRRDLDERLKKIKELLKKQKVLEMKKTWNKEIKEHPIKPMRPSGQLRGVCFSGRGWA